MANLQHFADTLTAFGIRQLELLQRRYFPGGDLPPMLGGHVLRSDTRINLAYALAGARKLGVQDIGGSSVEGLITRQLRHVSGAETLIFYSYFVAEVIEQFGGFDKGSPLTELGEAQIAELKEACDSTSIYDRTSRTLPRYPPNYWMVLLRCELARQRLGLAVDPTLLEAVGAEARRVLFETPCGFPDDSSGLGRYDIYSTDMPLFAEPCAEFLGREQWSDLFQHHVAHMETLIRAGGVSYAWGRSVGVLSVCLTLEMFGAALARGAAADPERTFVLMKDAAATLCEWFGPEGLINAHEYRSPFQYRGPHRRLQLTLDVLTKVFYCAKALRQAPDIEESAPRRNATYPAQDIWVPFNADSAGVWIYRDAAFGFQLAVAHGTAQADYVPAPRMPGLFENPVDSSHLCWFPRLLLNGEIWWPSGLPVRIAHTRARLELHYENWETTGKRLDGRCDLAWEVKDGALSFEIAGETPPGAEAVAVQIPEASRRLAVRCEEGVRVQSTPVRGLTEMRSFWSELSRLHEIFVPGGAFRTRIEVTPVARVLTVPGDVDYVRALYEAMPPGSIEEVPVRQNRDTRDQDLWRQIRDVDILHIGWPEHLFDGPDDEVLAAHLDLIEASRRIPLAVVWTQHNRLGHNKNSSAYQAIYCAWAERADAIIHHTLWGRDRMRGLLPYRADAVHAVIPHGHFGAQNRPDPGTDRASWEARFNLPPCRVRLGVVGRPQKEKRVGHIMEAFSNTAPPDWQLWVTALAPDDAVPDDPRIFTLRRRGILPRQEIANQLAVCDALVSAHTGENYLTSGVVADAVGLGLPLIAPDQEYFREALGEGGLYYRDTTGGLEELFRTVCDEDVARARAALKPLQEQQAWPRVASETFRLLKSLGLACR